MVVERSKGWRGLCVVTVVSLLGGAALVACSESGDNDPPARGADGGTDGGAPVDVDSGEPLVPDDGGSEDGALPFDAGEDLSTDGVVINEISGGDEWVELFNGGTTARDVTGWRLADRDKTTGTPKLAEAVTFPAGTVLAVGEYLLVRGGGVGDAGKPCPRGDAAAPDAGSLCFNAEFGISNKDGESLFLLDADDAIVGKVVYPPRASSGSTTWSRVPNGAPDAGFKNAPESPYAPNDG